MVPDVAPVFHVYDVAPLAVRVAGLPGQIVGLFTVIVGLELTITDPVICAVQELLAPKTVTVVDEPGEIV